MQRPRPAGVSRAAKAARIVGFCFVSFLTVSADAMSLARRRVFAARRPAGRRWPGRWASRSAASLAFCSAVKYKYPPDKQPKAIRLVMDQMESMAPRYADEKKVPGMQA